MKGMASSSSNPLLDGPQTPWLHEIIAFKLSLRRSGKLTNDKQCHWSRHRIYYLGWGSCNGRALTFCLKFGRGLLKFETEIQSAFKVGTITGIDLLGQYLHYHPSLKFWMVHKSDNVTKPTNQPDHESESSPQRTLRKKSRPLWHPP